MNPDLAVGREADADGPAVHRNDLRDRIGLRVDDEHAIVVAHRVIELIGAGLNRQEMAAAEHDVDLTKHLVRLRVVDDDARNVGVLQADVQFAAVTSERDAVRRRRAVRA
jgi:hypothetical protein